MKCKYLGLRIRDIILASLFIRSEGEIRKSELAQKPRSHGFSIIHAHVLIHNHARCRIISHKARGILSLLAPETPVHRKELQRNPAKINHFTKAYEPARGHVASQCVL